MKRRAALVPAALLLAISTLALSPAAAQEARVGVEVQVLDAETLVPIPYARFYLGKSTAAKSPTHGIPLIEQLRAGPDGVVKLSLPAGVQGAFNVDPGLTQCGSVFLHGLDELERTGLLGIDDCDPGAPARAKLRPVPGRAILFATPTCCLNWKGPAPEIRVLVLNGITGRPMRRLQLEVYYASATGGNHFMSDRTDDAGVLRVVLPKPISRVIGIMPFPPDDYPGCSYGGAMTDVVLEKGFVQQDVTTYCRRRGSWKEPRPVPGELVMFTRRRGFLSRLLDY